MWGGRKVKGEEGGPVDCLETEDHPAYRVCLLARKGLRGEGARLGMWYSWGNLLTPHPVNCAT